MEAAERNAVHKLEAVHLRMTHCLKSRNFFVHYVGGTPKRGRMGDKTARIDIYRRIDSGPAEGEAAELDGVEREEGVGQPEPGIVLLSHSLMEHKGKRQ